MKRIITNYRYYVLAVFMLLTILGIFSAPSDTLPTAQWLYVLISSKLLGFAFGYVLIRLTARWERLGTIPELVNTKNNY